MEAFKNITGFIVTLFFFTNFIVFGYLKSLIPLAPVYSVALIFFITIGVSLYENSFDKIIFNKLIGWIFFYVTLVLIFAVYGYFAGVRLDVIQEKLVELLLCVMTMLIVLFIFNNESQFKSGVLAIVISIFLGVLFILIDLFNPLSFSELIGRGSGMYLNANYAGASLLIGLIYVSGKVRESLFLFLLLLVGLGVFATFSRTAIAFYLLYIVVIFWRKPQMILLILSSSILILWIVLIYIEAILPEFISLDALIYDRLSFLDFSTETANLDISTLQRKELLSLAYDDFMNSPIFGGGLGKHAASAKSEFENQLAHNTYLVLLVDYGYLGILIIPLLLYSIYANSYGKYNIRFIMFSIFILVNGFFSHNLLDHYVFLFFYALFASEIFLESKKQIKAFA